MRVPVLSIHPELAGSSRLPVVAQEGQRLRAAEVMVLLSAGIAAALASALPELGLRIPGHAILRAVFPMALGLALVPRRLGGMVMGVGAVGTAIGLQVGHWGSLGAGALASLALTGPLLDLALARARRGWGLYLAFVLAGLGSNLAALAARVAAKLVGLEHPSTRPLAEWWMQAAGSYVVCGMLAGLISALVWFQFAASNPGTADRERPA